VDLVIREDDGWEELDDFQRALADAPPGWGLSPLWRALGQGQYDAAVVLLEELGFEFSGEVKTVKLIAEPDDMLGDSYRIWVRYE
jgi:hypothetical protein